MCGSLPTAARRKKGEARPGCAGAHRRSLGGEQEEAHDARDEKHPPALSPPRALARCSSKLPWGVGLALAGQRGDVVDEWREVQVTAPNSGDWRCRGP